LLTAIAEMPAHDRSIGKRLHALIKASAAPDLSPKTWYGMPAYAKDGTVLCYFRSAHNARIAGVALPSTSLCVLCSTRSFVAAAACT
jgi:hypothetical protein